MLEEIYQYGFKDYLKDYLCNSSQYKNYMYSSIDASPLSKKKLEELLEINLLLFLARKFKSFRSRLFDVRIDGIESSSPEDIVFDFKHGWTLTCSDGPVFLGKIDTSAPEKISIGTYSYLSGRSTVDGNGELTIGRYCSIAADQYFFSESRNHPYHNPSTFNFKSNSRIVQFDDSFDIDFLPTKSIKEGIKINNDVWIGRNCTILNGVTISNGCVIGANSTVTKDTVPYGIYVGSPAKLIKTRFPQDMIDLCEDIKWWTWSLQKLNNNSDFFNLDLRKCTPNDVLLLLK